MGVFAQTGTISGIVSDNALNDVLPFVNVSIGGTTAGTTTDFDGKYSLEVAPGTYNVFFTFIGYQTVKISDIVVQEGKETFVNADMKEASSSLKEVIITTTLRQNNEKAITKLQKKSSSVLDGLSSQSIKTSGASNAAAAVKQVPGVSIQGGKYVYVRGLGDRYTKTTLNSLDVPGLDPDRNALQVDIFPSNLLENLVVYKSASANLPADFTGGVVDITLKDFSSKPEYTVSAGVGFNFDQHLQDNSLSFDRNVQDHLGFGIYNNRNVPLPRGVDIPGANANFQRQLVGVFDPQLRASNATSSPNFNIGITASNGYDLKNGNQLGYQANLNYKSDTDFYQDAEDGIWGFSRETGEGGLGIERVTRGRRWENNTLLTGLLGLTYKTDKSKYKFSALHIQNGISRAARLDRVFSESGTPGDALIDIQVDGIEYTEKSLTNIFVGSKHRLSDRFELDWKLGYTSSKLNDLDHRVTPLRNDDGIYTVSVSDSGSPIRIWRFLDEKNLTGRVDWLYKYSLANEPSKLKGGIYQVYKNRDFSIDDYRLIVLGDNNPAIPQGDPNFLLTNQNIIDADGNGTAIQPGDLFEPANAFEASQRTSAGYISTENKFGFLKTVLGLRAELFQIHYTGTDNQQSVILNDERIVNESDLFPSVNLIAEVNEKINVRGSYSRTAARPTFKESAISSIADPTTGRVYTGALAFGRRLESTIIDNIDARVEYFGEKGDVFSVSGFHKILDKPLEQTFAKEAFGQITTSNLNGEATVNGVEFEAKKNLGFITQGLENLRIRFNYTFIESSLVPTDDEKLARGNDDNRPLQGQSPFLVNGGLEYTHSDSGFTGSLSYNVQGRTLELVASSTNPDVYTKPFNSLNLNLNKKLGSHHTVNLKADNILNSVRESVYVSDFTEEEPIYSRRKPGTTVSLGYTYKF